MTAQALTFLPDELAPAFGQPLPKRAGRRPNGRQAVKRVDDGGAVHERQRSTLPPLVLPTEVTPEARAYLDGFDHQWAAYCAWHSTAVFLAGQSDRAEDDDERRALLAGAFDAYDKAQAIANRFTTQPELWHKHSAEGVGDCLCPVCLWDMLSAKWGD